MASVFSGVLQLTDLDDFITPSQVSVKNKKKLREFIPEGHYKQRSFAYFPIKMLKAQFALRELS